MEIGKRTEGSPNRRKNGWMESNVFPTTTGPPSIFRPLHRTFSPLPLFLPLSRVISSFTFLVSASSSHPPSRAPLTAFSRFPTLIHLACLSISIRYLFYQFTSGCTRVARPGNSCSVARLTTPRRNFEEERERERRRNRVRSLSFPFAVRSFLLFEENRDRGKFSTGLVASSARNFFSAQNYALGPCIMYIFVRWGEGARSSPGRKYSKGAWWCTILLLSRQ